MVIITGVLSLYSIHSPLIVEISTAHPIILTHLPPPPPYFFHFFVSLFFSTSIYFIFSLLRLFKRNAKTFFFCVESNTHCSRCLTTHKSTPSFCRSFFFSLGLSRSIVAFFFRKFRKPEYNKSQKS